MKRKFYSLIYSFTLFLLITGCAGAVRTTSSGTADSKPEKTVDVAKAEDLSKYRPKYSLPESGNTDGANTNAGAAVVPANHVNQQVAVLMDTVASMNKSFRYSQGFRIQAYSGTERKAAMDTRTAIVKRLPDEPIYQQYNQPTWRLKVGDYFNRIEAQQALLQIKDIAPNAMIVVDQINVK